MVNAMTTNHTAVIHRRPTSEYETYADAVTLHETARQAYRRNLHRHGALHPSTREAQTVATVLSLYLADARSRLYRARAGR